MQFAKSGGEQPVWQTDEQDENGVVVAQYRQTDPGQYEKRKLRYRQSHIESARHRVITSESHFTIGQQAAIVGLSVDERIGVSTSLPVPEMESRLKLELALTGRDRENVKAEWLSDAEEFEAMRLAEAGTRSAIEAELDQAMASRMTFEQAPLRLYPDTNGKPRADRADAYHVLMGHLRLEPASTKSIVDHVHAHGPLSSQLISVLLKRAEPNHAPGRLHRGSSQRRLA